MRLCVCEDVHPLATATHVTVVIHALERKRASNSGKLLCRSLVKSSLVVFGEVDAPLDMNSLLRPGMRNVLLYPLTTRRAPPPGDEPLHLIVPDGNWKQAGKIARRFLETTPIVPVALPFIHPSRYRLRHAVERPEGLATFEATAVFLGQHEGEETASALMSVFDKFVTNHLVSRCKIKAPLRS